MPELIKVGYSMQDPELRARELDHTGSPHPYVVEYEMMIENPQQIEQQAHHILSRYREGKEWFRCTAEEAVAAIRQIAGNTGNREIYESFKKANEEEAERLRQEAEKGGLHKSYDDRIEEIEDAIKEVEKEMEENVEFRRKKQVVNERYNNLIKTLNAKPGSPEYLEIIDMRCTELNAVKQGGGVDFAIRIKNLIAKKERR
jgi:small-conductance mechanosensitive channel